MLYSLLKIWVRFASFIFCRKVIVNDRSTLLMDGPLLLAVNHPNSFLDAIILDIYFKRTIWSLSRGDVFKNSFYTGLLTRLKILPVFRVSEGVENLETNYSTFASCKKIFQKKGLVLMFSEGKCINEWHLRPLKKGTARLAISSWDDGIDLKVLPVGINYSSFTRFGKNIFINFGDVITRDDIDHADSDGKKNLAFNLILEDKLKPLVFEIPLDDKKLQAEKLGIKISILKKIVLIIPAIIGWLLNAPFYYPVKMYAWKNANGTDHYDSVMVSILTFFYPIYITLMVILFHSYLQTGWEWAAFVIFPLLGRAAMELNGQLDRARI